MDPLFFVGLGNNLSVFGNFRNLPCFDDAFRNLRIGHVA
jgi:hypothetical protein